MKKPGSTSSKKNRHAKSTSKPVTIDLKAEAVTATNPSTDNDIKTAAAQRSSVPKTKAKEDTGSPKGSSGKATFGRDGTGHDSEPVKPAEKPANDQPEKSETKLAKEVTAKADKPASSSSSGASKPVQASSGSTGRFVAAVTGGLVALGAAGALQYSGLIPSLGSKPAGFVSQNSFDDIQAGFETKLAELQSRLDKTDAALSTKADTSAVGAIDQKLGQTATELTRAITTAAEGDLDEVTGQVNETTVRVETLQAKVDKAAEQIASLHSLISGGDAGPEAGSITTRLETTAEQLKLLAADVTTLKAGAFDLANKAEPAPADTPETLAALESLKAEVPALKTQLAGLGETITKRLETLDLKTASNAAIADEVASLKSAIDSLASRTAEGEATITALRQQSQKIVEDTETVDRRAARAIAAASLKSQIDAGVPYSQSLKTLMAVTGDNTELAKLEQFSENGIPGTATLGAQFEAVGERIVAATTPPPKDDLASRLMAGAKSFIKVEPLQPATGDTPGALVSQIAAAMSSGKLDQASALWSKLPDAGKQVSADWHKALEARIAADTIVSQVVQSFLLTSASN